MSIILVSGPRDSGKTAYLRSLAASGAWGCLAPKVFNGEGVFQGYDLQVFPYDHSYPLARLRGSDSPRRVTGSEDGEGFIYGPFFFYNESFRAVKFMAEDCTVNHPSVLFLDEIGPVEMAGKGLAPALEILLSNRLGAGNHGLLYLSVRPALVEDVQFRFSFRADRIIGL